MTNPLLQLGIVSFDNLQWSRIPRPQFNFLVMQRAGLAADCILSTRLTELTGLMHLGILSNFSDDLYAVVSER